MSNPAIFGAEKWDGALALDPLPDLEQLLRVLDTGVRQCASAAGQGGGGGGGSSLPSQDLVLTLQAVMRCQRCTLVSTHQQVSSLSTAVPVAALRAAGLVAGPRSAAPLVMVLQQLVEQQQQRRFGMLPCPKVGACPDVAHLLIPIRSRESS